MKPMDPATPPSSPAPNSADLYAALNVEPTDHVGGHRFIHVIGTSVFVDTQLADESWGRHVVGIVEGEAWWGGRRAA
jgi:NAD+ diphosphatase